MRPAMTPRAQGPRAGRAHTDCLQFSTYRLTAVHDGTASFGPIVTLEFAALGQVPLGDSDACMLPWGCTGGRLKSAFELFFNHCPKCYVFPGLFST